MTDPDNDELRNQLDQIAREFGRAIEQVGDMARQTAGDLGWPRGGGATRQRTDNPPPPNAGATQASADAIRELGKLRDEGLISEYEFEAKKAELLRRL